MRLRPGVFDHPVTPLGEHRPHSGPDAAGLFRDIFDGDDRTSHVPGEPFVHLPSSSTPPGPMPPSLCRRHRRGPRYVDSEGSRDWFLSRLDHTASALAVYASPSSLPPPTQDSLRLPARLYRVGLAPTGSTERFPSHFMFLFLLSQARLTLGKPRGATTSKLARRATVPSIEV
jgi:hypothetical protein